jgi:hypothetical protein
MNTYDKVHGNRVTGAIFAEPNKNRSFGVIATHDEIAIGGKFKVHEKVTIRSFFDLFRFDTRQEVSVKISDTSSITGTASLRQNGKFSAQVGINLVA